MNSELNDKRVAIITTDGVEEVELVEPRKALEEAGARTAIVSPKTDKIKAWDRKEWGNEYEVDLSLDEAKSEDFDCLMVPGGVMNPDKLRMDDRAVQFVKDFLNTGKPIAAICHGPQVLIETGDLKGRKMTSYPALKTDLKNAGVEWVDQEVVVDRGLTTSRSPDDIPAFNRKMIEEFREGVHSEMPS